MADIDHNGLVRGLPEPERQRLIDFVRDSRETISLATGLFSSTKARRALAATVSNKVSCC
jgi:hypothetical protein